MKLFLPYKTLNYRLFNYCVYIIALFPVLSIGLFNLAIDPYGIIGSPNFSGINRLKPEQDKQNKLFKAVDVIRFKPTTVVIGSSRAILGLDPKHPALLDQKNAYNLGIPGAHIHELRRYVYHAIANQPNLKQIVIGLDFFMFSESKYDRAIDHEILLEKTRVPLHFLANMLFSLEAFDSSKTTLYVNQKDTDVTSYYSSGMRNNTKEVYQSELSKKTMEYRFKVMLENYLNNPNFYKNYKLSQNSLQELKLIIDTCKQRNIDVKVFISPEHATQLEAIRLAGLWSVFEAWKKEVRKITPVWDFSNYNSITTEPIENQMKYFLDATHYRKEVGDLILNRVLYYQPEKVPKDFGTLITGESIEPHLTKIRAARDVWVKSNPDEVRLVQSIKVQLDKEREFETR